MKKLLSFLLIMALLLTAIPSGEVRADSIQLNYAKVELSEGDTFKLELTGADTSAIWNTTNKNVATVTSDGVVTAVNTGKAKITARVSKKKYVCKVTVVKNLSKIRPVDAFNFVNNDIVGYGFYVLQNYIYNGQSSYGESFETTLKNLDANMVKLSQYNDSINAFDGEEYDDLKTAWNNLYTEISTLCKTLVDNPPKLNDKTYKFDLANVKNYLNEFLDECKYFEN
jgi:hypothetical protein